jgi:mono/diheme cytochrome c family protein
MLILANSTQRTIGLVIALTVGVAFVVYVLVNVFSTGKDEIGAEIELAPNRKPYFDDAQLETKKLDLSLAFGVGTLAIIALALPLYWLGEPGRHQGFVDKVDAAWVSRGGEQYEALCAQCHGANGVGGAAPYTVLDEEGRFVTSVSWAAPSLNSIFYRFSEEEITYVLNYGRPQSPMPAWGGPGGGPLTSQQLEELITWMGTIQLSQEEVTANVQQGLRDAVFAIPREENPELFETASLDDGATAAQIVAARQAQEEIYEVYNDLVPGFGDLLREEAELNESGDASIEEIEANREAQQAALDAYLETLEQEDLEAYGGLLFNNTGSGGAYNCARCHTSGWSWNAGDVLEANPELENLIPAEIPGSGGFGPSLIGVADSFTSAEEMQRFISIGCSDNLQYGINGVCEVSGQMPGFGEAATDTPGSSLTEDQIAAIVAYERGLE